MIVNKAGEFYVNGHQCEVKYERREHYSGWIDGEQITSGHNTSHIRETLIDDAKYRVEAEPDFWKVCRAVHNFVVSQTDRDGNQLWVYNETVINNVTPLESVGPAYSALLELENIGLVEEGQICMDLNIEKMWKAVPEAEVDVTEERPQDPWEEYES